MTQTSVSEPAFGEADLSNCEREQIHLAASIQPHGALLVLHEPELTILQASANASTLLEIEGELVGRRLDAVAPDVARSVSPLLAEPLDALPVPIHCHVGSSTALFDGLVHRPPRGGLVVELEHSRRSADVTSEVERCLAAIVAARSIRALCDETARAFRTLTGYDRVMVYRFDSDGHGEVFAEEKRSTLEAFLGNHYPASDIPQIARRLYERNRVRVLVNVDYEPIPILPRLSPLTGEDLDMSLCFTRSMSPIHIQYLKNMGVRATLVVSLLVGGQLWGLVSCHHYESRQLVIELRAVCELLAEAVGTRIAALESFAQSQAELSVRRLEQRMIDAISRDGDWRTALFDPAQSILRPVGAHGAALLLDDQILTTGEVPGTQQLREIGRWLDSKGLQAPRSGGIYATCSLGVDEPAFGDLIRIASGLLAARVSNTPGEYLVWFRPEQVQTVIWGGDPQKPFVVGNSSSDLSPRRSFAQWHQIVEGTSEPWTPAAQTTARLIGDTVTDVVIQFRAVAMLIAQNQLDLVRRQVERSEQAVLVAGVDGRILMQSQALLGLLPAGSPVESLADLPRLFANPTKAGRRVRELIGRRHAWRGEAELTGADGRVRPVLVRADPVFSAPERVLGFVVVIIDLSDRKAADAARRGFQKSVVERGPLAAPRVEGAGNFALQNMLSSILENARLAALEIADGVEVSQMPMLLESVQRSVDRAATLLRHLMRHAIRVRRD